MDTRQRYLESRKELLDTLKKLGVDNPAALYPTVPAVAGEDDPTCTILRMKHHVTELTKTVTNK